MIHQHNGKSRSNPEKCPWNILAPCRLSQMVTCTSSCDRIGFRIWKSDLRSHGGLLRALRRVVIATCNPCTLGVSQPWIFGWTFPTSNEIPRSRYVGFRWPERQSAIVGKVARRSSNAFSLLAIPGVEITQRLCLTWVCHPDKGLGYCHKPNIRPVINKICISFLINI